MGATGPLEQAGRHRGAMAATRDDGQRAVVSDFADPAGQFAARDMDRTLDVPGAPLATALSLPK